MPALAYALLFLAAHAPQSSPAAVRQQVARGYRLAEQGDLKAAETELRQAVKMAPEDPVALAGLGTVLSQTSGLEEANRYLERALTFDPTEPNTRYNLAFNLFRLGKLDAARANLEGILKQHPDHKQAASLLAATRAKAAYDVALERYRSGEFAESRTLLERMTSSRDPQVLRLLAWCYQKENRPHAALATMRQAIELAPNDPTLYASAAQILIEQRNFRAASGAVTKALGLAPENVQALKLQGELDTEHGDLNKALQTFERATALAPSDPDALERLGTAQRLVQQYQKAAATFEQGIARFPSNARLYEAYAELLLDPGMGPEPASESHAIALLESALALDGSLGQAHYQLGKLLREQGKYSQALPHLETAAKLDQNGGATHLELAGLYRELGRPADQARELARYRELLESR
jgi:protein O-GlcNAc transferase